jgi:catechol 2,3-dioxygenase
LQAIFPFAGEQAYLSHSRRLKDIIEGGDDGMPNLMGFDLSSHNYREMIDYYENRMRFNKIASTTEKTIFKFHSEIGFFSLSKADPMTSVCRSPLDHLAFKLPSRQVLGQFLHHLILTQTEILGAIDHGTSEAIYLEDPDGNRIEVTCDKLVGEEHVFVDKPFDYQGVYYASNPLEKPFAFPEGASIGHVSLMVNNSETQQAFYVDLLGFSLSYEKPNFKKYFGNGSLTHQLSLRTGNAPLCKKSENLMLLGYPDCESLEKALTRLQKAEIMVIENNSGYLVKDYEDNNIQLILVL